MFHIFIIFFSADNGISIRSLSPLALTTNRSESQATTPSSIASALNNVTMVLQGASTGGGSSTPTSSDYSRYVRRFSSCQECGSARCRDLNYRYT